MIIPSIDLMNGHAVQLVGGKEKALDAGDPIPLAETFRLSGEVAVIDLDAALGTGSNEDTIQRLLRIAACRVGGGIRSLDAAVKRLDAGAAKIILGTRAVPEILRELPRERLIAAVDAEHGQVVIDGWRTNTGVGVLEKIRELRPYVSGFLVTFVEREGRLTGTDLQAVAGIIEAAGEALVTVAGGVSTPAEIAELDRLGADAQVGMALYTGRMDFADAIAAPLSSDRPDGLWPTVVCDERGAALGLCWSSSESLREAVRRRRGIYHSRKRGLWVKGEFSGNTQDLLRVDLDCDRDTLRFVVRQTGSGFCHLPQYTCFGEGTGLEKLIKTLEDRKNKAPDGSYTKKLFADPGLLRAKIVEEAQELGRANTKEEVIWEAADVLYFTLTAMTKAGVSLADVERELLRRSLTVSRREPIEGAPKP